MELETMKQAVVDALEDIKGYDITVMDVRKLTSMASYMIVANASSSRQTKAMANNVIGEPEQSLIRIRFILSAIEMIIALAPPRTRRIFLCLITERVAVIAIHNAKIKP